MEKPVTERHRVGGDAEPVVQAKGRLGIVWLSERHIFAIISRFYQGC